MDKSEMNRIIISCALQYEKNYSEKNLLFVFGKNYKKASTLETEFLPKHFLHLTGVDIKNNPNITSSTDFYNKCIKLELSKSDYNIKKNTKLKLSILPNLMNIHKNAKMVGDYNFSKSVLYTEKLAGNVTASLGFVRDDEFYVPNTSLKEDIRNITVHPTERVLGIFRKDKDQEKYSELCYIHKDINLKDLINSKGLSNKIDTKSFISDIKKSENRNISISDRINKAKITSMIHNKSLNNKNKDIDINR